MLARRVCLPIAIALVLGGCGDAAAPVEQLDSSPHVSADNAWSSSAGLPTLRQSPAAPPLQAYQVSFVAANGKESKVTVNYQPVAGQKVGDPFLSFYIPKTGLVAGAGGVPLSKGDSLVITITIDPVNFAVDFQPSGVLFSSFAPATLTLWYENANPDLNGDGVVDSTDQALRQQLTLYYQLAGTNTWTKQASKNDPTMPSVTSALYHFSEYAVSW